MLGSSVQVECLDSTRSTTTITGWNLSKYLLSWIFFIIRKRCCLRTCNYNNVMQKQQRRRRIEISHPQADRWNKNRRLFHWRVVWSECVRSNTLIITQDIIWWLTRLYDVCQCTVHRTKVACCSRISSNERCKIRVQTNCCLFCFLRFSIQTENNKNHCQNGWSSRCEWSIHCVSLT